MKKFLALVLAGAFAFSMTVCAAPSPHYTYEEIMAYEELLLADAPVATTVSMPAAPAEPAAPARPAAEVTAELYQKTVSEYSANAITDTPGLTEAAAVAQGGGVVINGAASNATFTLERVESGTAEFAKSQANALGGELLNVVSLSAPGVNFANAQVTFYVEGVTAGQNVQAYQSVKGVWTPLTVSAVTDNGVEITLTSAGTIAFIAVP